MKYAVVMKSQPSMWLTMNPGTAEKTIIPRKIYKVNDTWIEFIQLDTDIV